MLSHGAVIENWRGRIYVDKIGQTNEDPYIFHDPWLYSYCHASQLRRVHTNGSHLQIGSWLFFVSGQAAEQGVLAFDTIFLIGALQPWRSPSPTEPRLPAKYQYLMQDQNNPLYTRHLGSPFEYIDRNNNPAHGGVKFTYEADLWKLGKSQYSFLPLSAEMQKTAIPFLELTDTLRSKIIKNVDGKRPVDLIQTEQLEISSLLRQRTEIQVLKCIRLV